jgi:hypothetical protein
MECKPIREIRELIALLRWLQERTEYSDVIELELRRIFRKGQEE